MELMAHVKKLIEEQSYFIENIDCTIIAQRPKLASYIPAMRQGIAETLGLPVSRVNVKATTEEGLGFTGQGQGMAAQAVCLLGEIGNYAGAISADALTVGCKRNVRPELAEVRGKRLLIASELEEGTRLSTSIVKQLCSTDEISAEKKYRDPFKFRPTHTLVLYTNHLPKVWSMQDLQSSGG